MLLVVDIDGILAELTDKQKHFLKTREGNWDDNFYKYLPEQKLIEDHLHVVKTFWSSHQHVVFSTGRSEKYRSETMSWLEKNLEINIYSDSTVQMRKEGDIRRAKYVKADNLLNIFYRFRLKSRVVKFALEDQESCKKIYRYNGFYILNKNSLEKEFET